MALHRPPRPPAGTLTDALRRVILRQAHDGLGLDAETVLSLHTQAEFVADVAGLLADIERRYELAPRSMMQRLESRAIDTPLTEHTDISDPVGAGLVVLELPDAEFLTAIEHAVAAGAERQLFGPDEHGRSSAEWRGNAFFRHIDDALRAHGVPFRVVESEWQFEWVGDPDQHKLTQPALLALADPRLGGPQEEFEEALRKRRKGTPKDLEDAVAEAAKAVESTLQVLHDELGVTSPRSQQTTLLFNSLVTANKILGCIDKRGAAASGPRNQIASHGQGATVREVPEELADASIAAAATAITLLAQYLP